MEEQKTLVAAGVESFLMRPREAVEDFI